MNKQEIQRALMTDDATARDFVKTHMVDQETFDFRLMFRELTADKPNHAKIGRLFQRAYANSINDYLSLKSDDSDISEIPAFEGTIAALEGLSV